MSDATTQLINDENLNDLKEEVNAGALYKAARLAQSPEGGKLLKGFGYSRDTLLDAINQFKEGSGKSELDPDPIAADKQLKSLFTNNKINKVSYGVLRKVLAGGQAFNLGANSDMVDKRFREATSATGTKGKRVGTLTLDASDIGVNAATDFMGGIGKKRVKPNIMTPNRGAALSTGKIKEYMEASDPDRMTLGKKVAVTVGPAVEALTPSSLYERARTQMGKAKTILRKKKDKDID